MSVMVVIVLMVTGYNGDEENKKMKEWRNEGFFNKLNAEGKRKLGILRVEDVELVKNVKKGKEIQEIL